MKLLTTLLLCAVLGVFATACSDDDEDDGGLRIGALLPLSGALQSYGEASRAALELARDTVNEDSSLKVELVVKDTTTNPQTALAGLQELHAEGVRYVVGPYASSEVNAVRAFADENGMVLVSPLSTAQSLAHSGDNVFRFTPDDGKEGVAVAAVAVADGITTIVPVSRDDDGNLGLQSGFRESYLPAGGNIVEGVIYDADEDDFDGVVLDIVAAIEAADSDAAETAVYLTAFGEVVGLFNAAADLDSDVLTSVIWYGSDSVALSAELVRDATAAGFAVSVGYPNPILGLRDEDQSAWQPVIDDLQTTLGRRADSFALAAYDALVVLHEAARSAGANAAVDAFKTAFIAAADAHVGLTGPTVLNEAGDRSSASFDFWAVCPEGSGFTWERTISYAVDADGNGEVMRTDC